MSQSTWMRRNRCQSMASTRPAAVDDPPHASTLRQSVDSQCATEQFSPFARGQSFDFIVPCRKSRSPPSSSTATVGCARIKSKTTTVQRMVCRSKSRRGHAHRGGGGCQPGDGEAGHCGEGGHDDRASRFVLERIASVDGKKYELLRLLLENNLAVYSSHLPLDAHPQLGNNARLGAALGLKNLRPFFRTTDNSSAFRRARK